MFFLRGADCRSEFFREIDSVFRGFGKFHYICPVYGGLAQLARALAWHARGHQFDPVILHNPGKDGHKSILIFLSESVPCIHKYHHLSSCSDRAQTGRGTIRIRTKPRAGSARAKKTAIGRKKTQSPVIQDNARQRTRLLKKISALYRHYREHRF